MLLECTPTALTPQHCQWSRERASLERPTLHFYPQTDHWPCWPFRWLPARSRICSKSVPSVPKGLTSAPGLFLPEELQLPKEALFLFLHVFGDSEHIPRWRGNKSIGDKMQRSLSQEHPQYSQSWRSSRRTQRKEHCHGSWDAWVLPQLSSSPLAWGQTIRFPLSHVCFLNC